MRATWIWVVQALAIPLSVAAPSAVAHAHAAGKADPVEVVRAVLQTPDAQLDLATAKLTFDKLIDPAIDIDASLAKIEQMVETVRRMAGPDASDKLKLTKVRDYIYVSGEWNEHQPYQYDMTDPLGRKPGNALLPNYLAGRRGNCITMPLLYAILARRLGLDATIAVVPFHTFVRVTIGDRTFNVEATSGAHVEGDEFYRRKTPMTDEAVANGVYMKTLTQREVVAVMADSVAGHLLDQKKPDQALAITELVLAVYPHDANALVEKGSAYEIMIDQRFRRHPRPIDIPGNLQGEYMALADKNREAFDQAEALGWRETEEPQNP